MQEAPPGTTAPDEMAILGTTPSDARMGEEDYFAQLMAKKGGDIVDKYGS